MLYKLTPTRVYRTYYGGKNIDRVTGVPQPSITRYPEDWLASVTEAFNPGHEVKGEGLSTEPWKLPVFFPYRGKQKQNDRQRRQNEASV